MLGEFWLNPITSIIEKLDLADFDCRTVLRIVTLDGRFISGTPVDRDLLRYAVAANRLGQEPLGCLLVPVLRQQEIDGLAGFIYSAVEVIPLTFDLDGGLVHAPARFPAVMEKYLALRNYTL